MNNQNSFCSWEATNRFFRFIWTGSLPNRPIKVYKILCRTSLYFYLTFCLIGWAASLYFYMRYLGEIKGDWIPMQCELISYTNLSMPAPMSESFRGLCIHIFDVTISKTMSKARILELTGGTCSINSRQKTHWPVLEFNVSDSINMAPNKSGNSFRNLPKLESSIVSSISGYGEFVQKRQVFHRVRKWIIQTTKRNPLIGFRYAAQMVKDFVIERSKQKSISTDFYRNRKTEIENYIGNDNFKKASEFNDDKHHACFAPITLFAPHLLSPSQRHLSGQSHFSLLNQISPLVHSSSSFASLNSPHVHPTQFTHSLPSVTDYQSSFIHANLPSYITLVQPEEVSSPSSVLVLVLPVLMFYVASIFWFMFVFTNWIKSILHRFKLRPRQDPTAIEEQIQDMQQQQ